MNGGRQQNINLAESVKKMKKKIYLQKNMIIQKKYMKLLIKEKKKHQELLDFINNF